jgi:hypothetical protein
MDTVAIRASAASVTGARHSRAARNGQDAAIAMCSDAGISSDSGAMSSGQGAGPVGVVVVTDGCSSGASSEVGARLGATLFARSLYARLLAGAPIAAAETWTAVRADVVRALADLLERMLGDREQAIHDMFLFTIVAAAATREGAAVWALGDGAYSFGSEPRVLGPFADNAPPYLAYDLLGAPQAACFEVSSSNAIVVATDGALDLETGLERFAADRYLDHPDALRRQLTLLARSTERIDWDERRVVRTPAQLQDDCAIGILRWSRS